MPADQFREGRLIALGNEAREELAIRWAGLLQPPQDVRRPGHSAPPIHAPRSIGAHRAILKSSKVGDSRSE